MRKLLIVAGVPIDDLVMAEALGRIESFVQTRRPHQVATVNADFVVKAWDDAELRHIINNADMLTADGMPLVWGARLLGVDLRGRVTGADLVPALAERGAHKGWRFFLLGGRPGIAERAGQILVERYPGLQVVGTYAPPFAPVVEMAPDTLDRIRAAAPDILLVAFGNPKQEKWIYMHADALNVPVSIGIGASLDFVAGYIPRAPMWMQNSGLEWLFRLIQEPGRMWKRYVIDLVQFARFFAIQWWRQRAGRKSPAQAFELKPPEEPRTADAPTAHAPTTHVVEIELGGAITNVERARIQADIEKMLAAARADRDIAAIRLNMRGVKFIDSAGLGLLVNLTKQARQMGKDLVLCGLQPAILTTLRMIKLDQFLTVEVATGTAGALRATGDGAAELETRRENGWLIVGMPARLEGNAARALRAQVGRDMSDGVLMVADFCRTVFVDSSGIAAMLAVQRNVQAAGGSLVLAGMHKDLRRVLGLSGVMRMFKLADSVKAVLAQADAEVRQVVTR